MKEILNIKKLLFLFITLTTLTNVSYASFPIIADTLETTIDTLQTEEIKQYHSSLIKMGIDLNACKCESCRNSIDPLTNNVEVKKVLKKNTKKIRNWTLIIVAIILLILVGIWIDNYDGFKGNGLG